MSDENAIRFHGSDADLNTIVNPQPLVRAISTAAMGAIAGPDSLPEGQAFGQALARTFQNMGVRSGTPSTSTGSPLPGASIAAGSAAIPGSPFGVRISPKEGGFELPSEPSPRIAETLERHEARPDAFGFRGGFGVKKMPHRITGASGGTDASETETETRALALLSTAWESAQPLLEGMHDNLIGLNARLTELAPVVTELREASKASSAETLVKPDKDSALGAKRLDKDHEREVAKERESNAGTLAEQQADRMADRLMKSLNLGAHGPRVAPSRR